MTFKQKSRLLAAVLGVAILGSCGRSLIEDPSFDLWCGDALCMPWESSGVIGRVKTWHVRDFGVELGDGATLSQLSTQSPVACIHFEVIADVTASAEVHLELDFNDDGTPELDQIFPESHWSKLSFNTTAPKWYRNVRFTMHKLGHGRAVLAQISATDDDCEPELPDSGRKNGTECVEGSQCTSGICNAQNDGMPAHAPWLRCGECAADDACPEGSRCGTRRNASGLYAACVQRAQELGAVCDVDAQCQSGHCANTLAQNRASCGECATDADCAPDRVCGIAVTALGPARACRARGERELGSICVADAECKSAVCVTNACSECRDNAQCEGGARCLHPSPLKGTLTIPVAAALCAGGAACNSDDDCASGSCQLPVPTCYACDGEPCADDDFLGCAFPRQLPGTCR